MVVEEATKLSWRCDNWFKTNLWSLIEFTLKVYQTKIFSQISLKSFIRSKPHSSLKPSFTHQTSFETSLNVITSNLSYINNQMGLNSPSN